MGKVKVALASLVSRFNAEESKFCATNGNYSETEVRTEFIDPLFSCLGWDMNNAAGTANSIKDVVREKSQLTETTAKRPDYTFRIAAQRKFFVEAKKPAIDIRTHKESAFQVRSYGWTAGLPISILTNFRTLRVYDTSTAPSNSDDANVGLRLEFDYSDFTARFDELLMFFGRESVGRGSIEEKFGKGGSGELPINLVFLKRFNDWRLKIAQDLHGRYPKIPINELNDIAQKVINRFVFIRMCEDRGIEGEERLKKVIQKKNLIELRKLFQELDQRYNTGLFDVMRDPLQSMFYIDAKVLDTLVNELYFPQAPYSFSVLDADFLGQVYELFLTKRMAIDETGKVILEDKPAYEGREVITTPQPLVDEIVRRTFQGRFPRFQNSKSYDLDKLKEIRILDMAAGSGRFLLRCLDELVDIAIDISRAAGDKVSIYKRAENDYRLSFENKCTLLHCCLFGIDIDFNAVEVTRFSLLIKLLEDETQGTLPLGLKILPNLDSNIIWGNSVVEADFANCSQDIIEATQPMDWLLRGFSAQYDAVVGNPPYVKTEDMKLATPHELKYYKAKYDTAFKQFDKYFIFIEKAASRLMNGGWLGMVVSNKWITIESGKKLRSLLSKNELIAELVDFGNELLFEGKSTYVCLLVLSKEPKKNFYYRHVDNYNDWLKNPSDKGMSLSYSFINQYPEASWVLPATSAETKVLTILKTKTCRMADIADVLNGIQTSADDIFAIQQWTESRNQVYFTREGRGWIIEKTITQPYLMDSRAKVKSYCTVQPDALVLFPYTFGANGEAVLIPPTKLRRDYPLAWSYLNYYKVRLINRDVSPSPIAGEFYRYGRHQALASAFKFPKIIYSVNQLGDKYGFDNSGVGFASGGTAGEVSITNPRNGYTIEFLLALLHQRAVEYFLRKRGSPFRGGYYSRGSAVVSDCPVPILNSSNPIHLKIMTTVTTLVRKIIAVQDKLPIAAGRSRETLEQQKKGIEQQIKAQFDLIWAFGGGDMVISLPGELKPQFGLKKHA